MNNIFDKKILDFSDTAQIQQFRIKQNSVKTHGVKLGISPNNKQ